MRELKKKEGNYIIWKKEEENSWASVRRRSAKEQGKNEVGLGGIKCHGEW